MVNSVKSGIRFQVYFWPALPAKGFSIRILFFGQMEIGLPKPVSREHQRGKYHCTVDLLFDWFGISCMTTDNFSFYLQNRLIQTGQTGGQLYRDTSPFGVPCCISSSSPWYAPAETCSLSTPKVHLQVQKNLNCRFIFQQI
jgi:hypothetical protein